MKPALFSKRNLWLAAASLLALLILTALLLWWRSAHERIERTINLPAQGEAAYNPLYLLRQSLRADGVDAESRRYLQLDQFRLYPEDTVVLYGNPHQLTASEAGALLGWVRRGGHLIVRLPPQLGASATTQTRPLLERLGVSALASSTRTCYEIGMPDELPEMEYCANTHFVLNGPRPDAALASPDDGLAFARLSYGHGTVDVWSHLGFLNTSQFQQPERAALVRQALAPNYGNGTVHLIYGAQMPSLWRLVFERGHMAWLPLLLALAAWLWLRIPRFGPLLPAPLPARRALLEHVEASGEHLYRYGRADVLLSALRDAFLQWLRRHDPLAASQEDAARIAAIAARTSVPEAEISDALNADLHSMSTAGFQQRAKTLVRMMRTQK